MATKSKSKKTSPETIVEQHEGVLKRQRAKPGQGLKKRKSRAKAAAALDAPIPRKSREKATVTADEFTVTADEFGVSVRRAKAKPEVSPELAHRFSDPNTAPVAAEPEVTPPSIAPRGRKRAAKPKAVAATDEKPQTSSDIVRGIFEADPEAKFSVIVATAVLRGVNANTARGVLVRLKQAALYKGA